MKYVLCYEPTPDALSKAAEHFAAHRARWADFQARGTLVIIGAFADAAAHGSMAIFTRREDAEEFASGDPFVLNGVVQTWSIRDWSEAIFP